MIQTAASKASPMIIACQPNAAQKVIPVAAM
jgi:hypothetical protein